MTTKVYISNSLWLQLYVEFLLVLLLLLKFLTSIKSSLDFQREKTPFKNIPLQRLFLFLLKIFILYVTVNIS